MEPSPRTAVYERGRRSLRGCELFYQPDAAGEANCAPSVVFPLWLSYAASGRPGARTPSKSPALISKGRVRYARHGPPAQPANRTVRSPTAAANGSVAANPTTPKPRQKRKIAKRRRLKERSTLSR
jgi:hypothetical protein